MNQTKLFAGFSTDFGFQKIKNISIKTVFLAASLLLVTLNILPTPTKGILDTSFDGDGIQTTTIGDIAQINATAVQPDGKIVATGSCTAGSTLQLVVTRYNIDGSLDLTFNTTGQSFFTLSDGVVGYGVAVQDDGKIVVTGIVYGEGNSALVARFLPNGLLDTVANGGSGFGSGSLIVGYITNYFDNDSCGYAVAIQPADQKIVITGSAGNNMFIARYTTAGELDSSSTDGNIQFNSGFGYITYKPGAVQSCYTRAVALDASGNIVVTGQAHYSSGSQQDYIFVARYLTDGTNDSNFNQFVLNPSSAPTGALYLMYSLGFQSDNKIILAGTDGTNALVVRLDANGFFDNTFGGSTNYFATTFGGSSAIANGVVVQDDDKVVIGGTVTQAGQQFAIGRILADGSGFDTTFGTNGYTKTTITPDGYNCGANSLALQENGRFVAGGSTGSATGNLFALTRYLGDAAPQGCMDVTYDSATTPGYVAYPTDSTASNSPKVTAMCTLSDGSVVVATQRAANSQLVQLSSTGQALTSVFSIAQTGVSSVIVDKNGKLVVSGTNGSLQSWMGRYVITAGTPGSIAFDTTFNSNSLYIDNNSSGQQFYNTFGKVGLQSDGKIVTIANQVDTFINTISQIIISNAAGNIRTSSNSVFSVTTFYNSLTDLLIDPTDNIYVTLRPTYSSYIRLIKLNADGSASTTYGNTNGTSVQGAYKYVATDLLSSLYGPARLSFDDDGNVYLAMVCTGADIALGNFPGDIVIYKYNATQTASNTPVAILKIAQTTTLFATPILTCLQCDTSNRLLLGGYDANDFFVARINSTFTGLDYTAGSATSFAINSPIPGILKSMYATNNPTSATTPHRVNNYVTIAASGEILFGGYENIDTSSTVSLVGGVVSDAATQVARYPLSVEPIPGTIDATFGTGGGRAVAGGLTGSPESINILSGTGDILVGVNDNATSNIAGLTNLFNLNTTNFGVNQSDSTSGITPQLPADLVFIREIITDNTGCIYVVGDNGDSAASLVKLAADGSTILWSSAINITIATSVVQQASGRILIGGYNSAGSGGVIVAYDPNTGAIDTSFNQGSINPGYYYIGITNSVMALSIVNYSDQILFVYGNIGNEAQVQRLLENGALDTSFPSSGGSATLITGIDNLSQMRMQHDNDGNVVVVATTSNGFTASRYSANGTDNIVNVAIDLTNPSTILLQNILCLNDNTTLILGQNSTGNTMVLAKLTPEFDLDVDFATGGILQTAVTSPVTMTNFYALGMSSAAPYNILVTADNGGFPYLVGIVSGLESAVSAVNQSTTSWGPAGTLDVTYNANANDSHEAGFFDLGNEFPSDGMPDGSVKAMVQMDNGSYFVLTDRYPDASESCVIKFDCTDTRDTSFSSSFVTIANMRQAHGMMIMQDGNLLIVGEDANNGYGIIVVLDPTDGHEIYKKTSTTFLYNYGVGQQPDGRIIVCGSLVNGSAGLQGLNPFTGEVDISFGVDGVYQYSGSISGSTRKIDSLVIDGDGNIYFPIKSNAEYVYINKVSSSGSVLWSLDSNLAATLSSGNNQIAFDQDGNVILAVSRIINNTIAINRYNSVDGSAGTPLTLSTAHTGISSPVIYGLLVDQTSSTGNFIIFGNQSQSPDNPFVLRVLSNLSGLDTSFNAAPESYPGVQSIAVTAPASNGGSWAAGFIGANGKITVGGYATFNSNKTYLMRLYGNDFVEQYLPGVPAGTPGNLDRGFAVDGYLDFADVSDDLSGLTAQVVLPLSNGYQYVAFINGTLIRLTNGNVLDDTFGDGGFAVSSPAGVSAMIMDANGCLVLVGTNDQGGWICRYASGDSGEFDTNFNDGDPIIITEGNIIITSVVEQTLARLVVAGSAVSDGSYGFLLALTNTGGLDVTFNSNNTPGFCFVSGIDIIPSLIADQYDRLIFPYSSTIVSATGFLARFTASGQYDRNIEVFDNIDGSGNLRVCFDADGNIVFAAQEADGISVIAYTNGAGAFEVVEDVLTITGLASPELTGLIATADGKILVSGNQKTVDATNLMWIARLQDDGDDAYQLDSTFNPTDSDYGTIRGIMQFAFGDNVQNRYCNSIAIYPDGTISIVGVEDSDTIISPFMSRAYDNPYTTQENICEFAQPIGTTDATLGVTNNVGNGILFAAVGSSTQLQQSAQAIALQDDQNILVACNSQINSDSPSIIVMNMFDVDGLLSTQFNGDDPQAPCITGQAIVLDSYDNQYVSDMLHFSVGDVNKAILAGYATNNALSRSNLLVMQYILDSDAPSLDTTFGGFNGDPLGVAMGNNASQAFTLGRQSMGRIIVGGYQQALEGYIIGLVQAYTSNGLLDQSFGQSGSYLTDSNAAIYASAIDDQDRVVIAYSLGDSSGKLIVSRILADGSGVDTSFNGQSEFAGYYIISYNQKSCDVSYSIALDQSGNIFIATAVWSEGSLEGITVVQLDADGNYVTSTEFGTAAFDTLNNFTITKLLITAQAEVPDQSLVLVGYDSGGAGQNQIMVASFVQSAIPVDGIYSWVLDTDYFNQADTPGYIKYAVGSQYIQQTAGAIIHPDGRVIIAGSVDEAP